MFQKVEKAHLAKQKWSKGASSSMRHLRVKPTQMHPKVEQQKSQADQHEAIGGIGRSRPAQQFIAKAIARLNAKPLPVSLPTLFRSPVQGNHYKHQPLGATLATSGAPRRGEDTADGQLRPELLLLAFIEDVLSAITRSPSTQSSGSAFLASDRTSDQRGLLAAAQVLEYRDAGKTFVEVEDANPQRPQQQRLPQLLDHFHGLIPWQYESNRQGHSLPMEDGVSCRDPIETSRPIFGFAAHPQGFLLFLLAVVGAVVKIEGDFYGAATSQFLRPVGSQAIVDRALQILQLFNRKLPPEIATNGLGIRSAGQFRADRLGRSTVGCDSNQDVIERVACDAIPVRFQRQEYFQGLFRLTQDFFIIEFWLIMIRRFIIIRRHGLFLQIHKESNKPFYFKPYGPHRPILGLLNQKPEDLLGQSGLLQQLSKALIERVLDGEMTHHPGYEKHSPEGRNSGNSRNGKSRKTLKGKQGEIPIEVPRDRNGEFDPQFVKKRQTRFDGFDDKIISLYARGMTTSEIQGHLEEIYGVEVSPELISTVTDGVIEEVRAWQGRPLEKTYVILYLDALVVKVKQDGRIANRSIYLAVGVNLQGRKEVLGFWAAENEGAKFWLSVVTELKNRGVQDVLIACVDGLKGFPEAIESIFSRAQV